MPVSARERSLRSRWARLSRPSRAWIFLPGRSRADFNAEGARASASSPSSKVASVLDGGPGAGNALPELRSRLPFPPAWRVASHLRCGRAAGLQEQARRRPSHRFPTFPRPRPLSSAGGSRKARCPPSPLPTSPAFCEQIGYLQARDGSYFAPLQGGPYTSPAVSDVLDWLRRSGLDRDRPELVGTDRLCFRPSRGRRPEALLSAVRARSHDPGLSVELAQGRNEGAKIETSAV